MPPAAKPADLPSSRRKYCLPEGITGNRVLSQRVTNNERPVVVVRALGKFPCRSSAVGTITFFRPLGFSCSCHSWLQKKKTLLFVQVNRWGMCTRPPIVYPG